MGEDFALDFTLVVACYNEEGHLAESVRQVREVLGRTSYTYEILFVDDCSRDSTREIIDHIVASDPASCRRLFNRHNMGRGATVRHGFENARGRWVGFVDIDLEVGAHYIPYCLVSLEEGADVVCGWRVYKFRWHSLIRYILSRGYSWLVRLVLRLPFNDTETGFKFFQRASVLGVLAEVRSRGWFWDTEVMARAYAHNLKVVEKPCLFIRKLDKKSSVHVVRDTLSYFVSLFSFRFFTWPGLVCKRGERA